VPALRTLGSGHEVACHWAEEIKAGAITPHAVETLVTEPVLPRPIEPPPV
jgi:peptide/nickel transport system ATP-binding protein